MKTVVRSTFALAMIAALLLSSCAPKETEVPAATQAPAATKAPAATDVPAPTEPPEVSEEPIPVTFLSMGADWLLSSLYDATTGEETDLVKALRRNMALMSSL